MKIFKNQKILTQEIKDSVQIGETIILQLNDASPYVNYTVLLCVSEGAFPYQGGFNELKKAVLFAESIEKPNLVSNYFQIIDLAGGQKMVVFYNLHTMDVLRYADALNYEYTEPQNIGESSIAVTFLNPSTKPLLEKTQDVEMQNMVSFGNYLLSKERRDLFANHPEFGSERLDERLSEVHHSDIENWRNCQ